MAKVKIKPFPARTKTFGTIEDAKAWACEIEDQLKRMRDDPQAVMSPQGLISHGASVLDAIAKLPRLHLESSNVGIYFLFYRNKCVHVGQSRRIHMRVNEHKHTRSNLKKFDSYSWVNCPPEDLDRLERFYIDALNPPLNITFTELNGLVAKLRRTPKGTPEHRDLSRKIQRAREEVSQPVSH